MALIHPFEPILRPDSRLLILGSFPSVKSRETAFYYGHPQNRFWKVMASILGCALPVTVGEKKAMLQTHRIALWDALKSCDITGSSDASIQNPVPNEIADKIAGTDVRAIAFNGSTAYQVYQKYAAKKPALPEIKLPSTSPANAQYSLDRLIHSWDELLRPYLA